VSLTRTRTRTRIRTQTLTLTPTHALTQLCHRDPIRLLGIPTPRRDQVSEP